MSQDVNICVLTDTELYNIIKDAVATGVREAISLYKTIPDNNPDELVTAQEIARQNHFHVNTVLDKIKEKKITKVRQGKFVAIKRKYIAELFKGND